MVRLPYRHFVTSWLPDDYSVMVKRDYRVISSHSSYRYDILKKKKKTSFHHMISEKEKYCWFFKRYSVVNFLKAATANELNNQHWMEKLFEE